MNPITRLSYLLFLLIIFAQTVSVRGQSTGQVQQQESVQPRVVAPQGVDQRMMTIHRLIRFQNYDLAIDLLEAVLAERPHDVVAQNLLMSCYERMQRYAQAETMARRFVQQSPENLELRVKLAELLILQEKTEEGAQTYRDAVAAVRQFDKEQYMMLLVSMTRNGMGEIAINAIDSLREEQSLPILFALERGAILERQLRYQEAADEYAGVLAEDTTVSATAAKKRLMDLLEFADSSDDVERTLLALSETTGSMVAAEILAAHYIKSERFDDAFHFAIQKDSLGDAGGNSLYLFITQCSERKLHAQVVRASQYVFANFSDASFAGDVTFRYAEALRGLGRYEEAINVYSRIKAEAPDARSKSEALYKIGLIYLDGLLDYPAALTCFDSIQTTYRGGVSYLLAARAVPIAHLRMGDVKTSRKHFDALKNRHLNDDMSEEVDYYLALLDFFDADYDSSEVGFRKLMVDYPRGYFVNDALSLVMLITDARGVPKLLGDYASALLYSERLMIDSARIRLSEVSENDDSTLADVALFNLAELEAGLKNNDEAVKQLDRLIARFPGSYYHPHGLKLKADILVERVETIEDAKEIYRYLLENYPNHPSITDVRKKLRALEAEPLVG